MELVSGRNSGPITEAAAQRSSGRAAGRLTREIVPLSVDLALARWQTMSGSQAPLARSGKSFNRLRFRICIEENDA